LEGMKSLLPKAISNEKAGRNRPRFLQMSCYPA
jgi:hypothetical protein